MAGGTWTVQNKVRPGAYLNFKSVTNPENATASRGVATMPLALNWGPEKQITEILSTDLTDGTLKKKLGYDANADEMILVRECLKNCYKLLAYRVNPGGVAARETFDLMTVTAKYPGIRGNDISVAVISMGESGTFEVITYLDGAVVDKQKAANIEELNDNDYVVFTGAGALTAQPATTLEDGANASASLDDYKDYFEDLKVEDWQVVGVPTSNAEAITAAVTAVRTMREDLGKKVQGVVYNTKANYEGIISTKQGYVTENGSVSAIDFVAYVTGISAGAAIAETNTYRLIDGAVAIVNPMDESEIIAGLEQGFMLISRRTDGAIVIEQDINTLTTYSEAKSKVFRKNRLIRTVDEICNSVSRIFENTYIGKVDNSVTGRDLYKQALVKYLNKIQDSGAIEGFGADDVSVTVGAEADSVVVTLAIYPVDAMEKLYMTVEVN